MTKREWWEVLNDLWQYIKKHNGPATDAEWSAAVREAERFQKKHDKKNGAKDLIMDVLEVWERRERAGK